MFGNPSSPTEVEAAELSHDDNGLLRLRVLLSDKEMIIYAFLKHITVNYFFFTRCGKQIGNVCQCFQSLDRY